MKKLYDERFEVWMYDEDENMFEKLIYSFDNEIDAIKMKRGLNNEFKQSNAHKSFVIIKQIRTTDLLNY